MGQLLPELETNLIDKTRTKALVKDETEYWDYKEDLTLDNPFSIANLSKDILGFHNRKGGAIIVGINKANSLVGFHKSLMIDSAKIRDKTRPYTGPNVTFYQGSIDLPDSNRGIWILLICPREGLPIPTLKNGPEKNNKPMFLKETYFVRDGDQTRPCRDPNDYERLFADASFSHLQAYRYDVDEPFFRLLAPHCEHFVGRINTLNAIQDLLDSRHWLITLDGVGGVGKTATAIELTRRLYEAQTFDSIISLSAKNKVWTQGVSAVQAGFAGLTQLLKEIAKVLAIDISNDTDELKQDVIQGLSGMKALLLIDNMEDIDDAGVFKFISNDIPEPVKVLVTSRIDKGWGGKTISIPEMEDDEAEELLTQEFRHFGYTGFIKERKEVKVILEVTGRVPLALKWAAALTQTSGSLSGVVSRISKLTSSKREYLDFCFASMFDALTDNARNVALLCPYLAGEWNTPTLVIALDLTEQEVISAIQELKDRGILLAVTSRNSATHAHQLLPLTIDFLRAKFNDYKELREIATKNLADAMATEDHEGLLTNWTLERRLDFLDKRISELLMTSATPMARKLSRLALNYIESTSAQRWKFIFFDGQASYQIGEKEKGLGQMKLSWTGLIQTPSHYFSLSNQALYYAEALLDHGNTIDEKQGLNLSLEYLAKAEQAPESLIKKFCETALLSREYSAISNLLSKLQARSDKQNTVYALKILWSQMDDPQFGYFVGIPLVHALRTAAKASWITPLERDTFIAQARKFSELLENRV